MRPILILLFSLATILTSCKKNSICHEGTVRNYTGLDGCGTIIELTNGTRIEPLSLPTGITLTPNRKVCIGYRERPVPSICMVGLTADITSLTYID